MCSFKVSNGEMSSSIHARYQIKPDSTILKHVVVSKFNL